MAKSDEFSSVEAAILCGAYRNMLALRAESPSPDGLKGAALGGHRLRIEDAKGAIVPMRSLEWLAGLGLPSPPISAFRAIPRLVALGLVDPVSGPQGRTVALRLTEAGQEAAAKLTADAAEQRILGGIIACERAIVNAIAAGEGEIDKARATVIDLATASFLPEKAARILAAMESKGLVAMVPDSQGRVVLSLTPGGRAIAEPLNPPTPLNGGLAAEGKA